MTRSPFKVRHSVITAFGRRRFALLAAVLAPLSWLACNQKVEPTSIVLATTTSVYDSGLLGYLLPHFREQTGIDVRVVAVGTGQALELGRRGDADVLITHAPRAESLFVVQGFGEERRPFMRNHFVLVGPTSDPARVRQATGILDALRRIARARARFVSRGDDSGTHQRELQLWVTLKLNPTGEWYIRSGSGMAQTLRVASELRAYTLTDLATYLANRDKLKLTVLIDRDRLLENTYSVIVVRRDKPDEQRLLAARTFESFLFRDETKAIIRNFRDKKTGIPLFEPLEAGAQ